MHNNRLIPVQDYVSLRRDASTNAIVDVDQRAYDSYKQVKESKIQERARVIQLEQRINNMESSLSDIKSLLGQLLEK
jgi:hypothetical protein